MLGTTEEAGFRRIRKTENGELFPYSKINEENENKWNSVMLGTAAEAAGINAIYKFIQWDC